MTIVRRRTGSRIGRRAWGAAAALLVGLARPAPAAAQPVPPGLEAYVDSIAAASLGAGRVAGLTVEVARAGEALLLKSYGYADLGAGVPTPAGAVYEAASIAKQVTAAAILKLAEEGRLALDDPLARHLPGFPAARGITLRHLLHHTAGLREYSFAPGFALTERDAPSRDSVVALLAHLDPLYPPGAALVYTNSAYLLLGLVVEAASGTDYADYLRDNLFAPAGMVDSSYCDAADGDPRRVRGHIASDGELRPIRLIDHDWSIGAASLCTTAADLVAWNEALHGGRILASSSYREMVAPAVLDNGVRTRYAAGLMIDSIFERPAIRHGGALPGFRSYLGYFPEDRLTVVVLANSSGAFDPTGTGWAIARFVLEPSMPADPPFRDPDEEYVGIYRGFGRNGERVLRLEVDPSGEAVWTGRGDYSGPLYHFGDDLVGGRQTRIHFVRDGTRVVGAWLDEVGEVIFVRREDPPGGRSPTGPGARGIPPDGSPGATPSPPR